MADAKISSCANATFPSIGDYKFVILDVDSTLVYTTESKKEGDKLGGIKITYRSFDDYEDVVQYVILRPGVKEFLAKLCSSVSVGIWSLAKPNYLREISRLLCLKDAVFNPGGTNNVHFIYSWNECHREGYRIFKPLKECPFGKEGKNVCIVDDTPCVGSPEDHQILIPGFYGDPKDAVLASLY